MLRTPEGLIEAMRSRTVTTSAKINVIDNIYTDGVFWETGKYAIFEGDGIELDGTYNVLEKRLYKENTGEVRHGTYTTENNIGNHVTIEGWYSDTLSDENGNFEETLLYNAGSFKNSKATTSKLHIIFSDIRDEYAVDFNVTIEGVGEIEYRNNTNKEIVIEDIVSNSVIDIEIYKWSKKYSRAKVLNMYLGTVYKYEDVDIANIHCKKGVDLVNEEIPSKEIEIKLTDINDEYNIFTESEWDKFDSDTRIEVYLGGLIEDFICYEKVDECYFQDIKKMDDELAITVTGMGILTKYNDVPWYKLDGVDFTPIPLQMIVNIGQQGNYSALFDQIRIDDEIINEMQTISRCYEKEMKANQYLNYLGIHCRSNIIETACNNLYYKRLNNTNPIAQIGLENMEENPEIEKNENASLTIKKYYYNGEDSAQEIYKGSFNVESSKDIYINPYPNVELIDTDIDHRIMSLNATIYNKNGTIYRDNITEENYEDYFTLSISPNAIVFRPLFYQSGAFKVQMTLNCTVLIFSSNDYAVNNKTSKKERSIDLRSVQSDDLAKEIGLWLANNYNKKYRFKVKINDTFTYELGDTVQIETGVYVNNKMIVKNAIIVGIEYEYNGALDYCLVLEGE